MKAPQVLAIALMALVSAPATAQTQNSPSDRAATKQQRVDRAKERLELSARSGRVFDPR